MKVHIIVWGIGTTSVEVFNTEKLSDVVAAAGRPIESKVMLFGDEKHLDQEFVESAVFDEDIGHWKSADGQAQRIDVLTVVPLRLFMVIPISQHKTPKDWNNQKIEQKNVMVVGSGTSQRVIFENMNHMTDTPFWEYSLIEITEQYLEDPENSTLMLDDTIWGVHRLGNTKVNPYPQIKTLPF